MQVARGVNSHGGFQRKKLVKVEMKILLDHMAWVIGMNVVTGYLNDVRQIP